MTGGFDESIQSIRIPEVSQCCCRIEPNFDQRGGQCVLENRNRFVPDCFQFQAALFGAFWREDVLRQFLHTYACSDWGFTKGQMTDHLQISGIVVLVTWVDAKDEFLVSLGFCHWLLDSMFIEVMEPPSNHLCQSLRVSNAAEVVSQVHRQFAFFENSGSTKDATSFQQFW